MMKWNRQSMPNQCSRRTSGNGTVFVALTMLAVYGPLGCAELDTMPIDGADAATDGATEEEGAGTHDPSDPSGDPDQGDRGDDGSGDDPDDADDPSDDDTPDDDPPQDEAGAPQLRMLLTDAPLDVDSVFVTISEVRVQLCEAFDDAEDGEDADGEDAEEDQDAEGDSEDLGCVGGAWQSVVEEERTFDLLTLQGGLTAELGLTELPAGHYGQIRLMVVEAAVVADAQMYPLFIPSGAQSGLKLNHGFDLEVGMQTTITLDFDAEKSVQHNPGKGWIMQPVIDVIADVMEPLPDPEPDPEPDPDPDPVPEGDQPA